MQLHVRVCFLFFLLLMCGFNFIDASPFACANIPLATRQRFIGQIAAAIHKNSDILVTISARAVSVDSQSGYPYSDTNLQTQFPDTAAFIDFYSVTHWGQVGEPDVFVTGNTVSFYGFDKPAVLVTHKSIAGFSNTDLVTRARSNGWKGIMLWSWNNIFSAETRGECIFNANVL